VKRLTIALLAGLMLAGSDGCRRKQAADLCVRVGAESQNACRRCCIDAGRTGVAWHLRKGCRCL
jgi:hypothetical protein